MGYDIRFRKMSGVFLEERGELTADNADELAQDFQDCFDDFLTNLSLRRTREDREDDKAR